MFDRKKIDAVVKKLVDALPPGAHTLKHDLEKNFHSILQTAFAKMDLVTRKEFDAQVAVLKRTREKLSDLENKIDTIAKHKTDKKSH
jgi:BMFP domain-containing protein YqiC